jgi:hypothetical protein
VTSGSGKSEAWKALQRALGRLRKEEPEDDRFQKVMTIQGKVQAGTANLCSAMQMMQTLIKAGTTALTYTPATLSHASRVLLSSLQVHVYTINPLALSNDELYGSFDQVPGGSRGCQLMKSSFLGSCAACPAYLTMRQLSLTRSVLS